MKMGPLLPDFKVDFDCAFDHLPALLVSNAFHGNIAGCLLSGLCYASYGQSRGCVEKAFVGFRRRIAFVIKLILLTSQLVIQFTQ